ncbi:MAG: hypothetical protein COA96_15920 [SAR86 cluster bacterium]|uniref:FecR protein domain-containing protein n=1 Tax=SAR86 cluster bacterium TaxID=2030880 RepID=A0A2A5AMB1_9GAMM|nr:MAG: hypothetical protein COA96_15920 [SAR86 cluster bacterium]
MKDKSSTTDSIDDAIDSIKADIPSAEEINDASERARAAIASQRGPQAVVSSESAATDSWDSIDDYIAAIPTYLANQLTPQQTLLFEEESRQSIPLRRALNKARGLETDKPENLGHGKGSNRVGRWAAAAMVAALAIALFRIVPDLPSFDQSRLAQVSEIDGQLYQILNGRLESLAPGAWIDGRQRIRSSGGSSAILTLDDGSQIEVDERSELSMTRRGSGNRIDVSRGRILVTASPQGSGTLDVYTNEFMVSVTGTIFEVAHGAKGSRVAVIEGSVNVMLQGDTTSLKPGDVMDSRAEYFALSVADEISWSRDADQYIAVLQEVAALQQDLEAIMNTAPRYSTRLLDLAPEDTAVYIAVPNAPEKISDVYDVIRARMQGSELLSEAWDEFEVASEAQYLDEVMSWLREVGYALGEETVLVLTMPQENSEDDLVKEAGIPIVLSEVDADAFRASFENQIERLAAVLEAEGVDNELEIAIVDDAADAMDGQLSILLFDDILVASIDAATLQAMQVILENGGSAFADSEMHELLSYSYDQGTEILGAVSIPQLLSPLEELAEVEEGFDEEGLDKVGLSNAEYLIASHQQNNGTTTITADLYFSGEREGAMAWLAAPSPMGSLEFFSADTTFVAAMLIKEPLSIIEEFGPIEIPAEIGAQAELDLFYNVMGILGGELALGLDGPALPTPAWKAVVEAYDETVLQESIEWSVARFNEHAVAEGIDASIELSSANVAGYNGYQVDLAMELTLDSEIDFDFGNSASFYYAYVDGYLVAAPNQALVDRAISFYESGSGLQSDSDFRELLSRDGYLDFSAVYFSRLGALVNDVLQHLPDNVSDEQQAAISALDTDIGPSMSSLIALPDKIHFAHSGSTQLPVQILTQLVSLQPLLESVGEQSTAVK